MKKLTISSSLILRLIKMHSVLNLFIKIATLAIVMMIIIMREKPMFAFMNSLTIELHK